MGITIFHKKKQRIKEGTNWLKVKQAEEKELSLTSACVTRAWPHTLPKEENSVIYNLWKT